MATNNKIEVLSEEFLMDLFKTCMSDSYVLSVVVQHVPVDSMPDRDCITLLKALKKYYRAYAQVPHYSAIREYVAGHQGAINLLEDISDSAHTIATPECLGLLEDYLKRVTFQKAFKEASVLYNKDGYEAAVKTMADCIKWQQTFSLTDSGYTNVVATFADRFNSNRDKYNAEDTKRDVTRFYIDELDEQNSGRSLRTQLTYILASTNVGKSHAARWIGRNACLDGLNVLHFQLEGSQAEVENAYSASLVGCSTYRYEHGTLRDTDFQRMVSELASVSGTLFVKSYPKFNSHITTTQIKEGIGEFVEKYTIHPDVIIIDSADLLVDSSGRKYGETGERYKRISVANDLKDMAADEDVWIVATYQSTIENKEWLDDEKNVLTEYNSSEAKGVARPLTHLITLNQSSNEREEQTMRIHVAKSRFFPKGRTFKIATDYDKEIFYDRVRTMNINKVH